MDLLIEGTIECARVAKIMLLVKCQDQVVSGKKRWQTRAVTEAAEAAGFGLLDALHFEGGRPQPEGRRQVHARQNFSTLLVFKRGHSWRHDGRRPERGAVEVSVSDLEAILEGAPWFGDKANAAIARVNALLSSGVDGSRGTPVR